MGRDSPPFEPSGEVPREVFSGIFWEAAQEADYQNTLKQWADVFPVAAREDRARAQAAQSARWGIELELLHKTIAAEVKKASALHTIAEKHAIHTGWLRTYGAAITDAIVRAIKDPELRSPQLARNL